MKSIYQAALVCLFFEYTVYTWALQPRLSLLGALKILLKRAIGIFVSGLDFQLIFESVFLGWRAAA